MIALLQRNAHKLARHIENTSTNCKIWTSYKTKYGYGLFQFRDGGIKYKFAAHRVVWALRFHHWPEPKTVICHSCDCPSCCNIDHLSAGTHRDNVRDRVIRHRSARGAANGRAKLTEQQVCAIRKKLTRMTNAALAQDYGVDRKVIYLIRKNKIWTHAQE